MTPRCNQRVGRQGGVAKRGTVDTGRRRGAGVRTRGGRSGGAVSRPGHGGASGRRVDPRGKWKEAGFQGREARVGRPESASLGVYEACKAGREPFQVDQARLVVQALRLRQGGSRGELGDRGRGERSGSSGAFQEQAIRLDRGQVLGLGEGRLRVCGRYESGRLAGEGGEGVEGREFSESGEYWRSRAHRPGIRGSTIRTANREAEVTDGGGGLQNTTGCSFVSGLVTPAKFMAAGLDAADGIRGGTALHAERERRGTNAAAPAATLSPCR